jgi:hypothetical protein
MPGSAIALMVAAIVIVWGGLAVSAVFLAARPEVSQWPSPAPAGEPGE